MLIQNVSILNEAYAVNGLFDTLTAKIKFEREWVLRYMQGANRAVEQSIQYANEAGEALVRGEHEEVDRLLKQHAREIDEASAYRGDALVCEDGARESEDEIDRITGCVVYLPETLDSVLRGILTHVEEC